MTSDPAPTHKHRVLIGEKSRELRNYLLAVLRADDHDVVATSSGTDLLDALAVSLHPDCGSGEFDLVISEDRILGSAELQAFQAVARRAKVPPLVFMTNFASMETSTRAEAFGAVAVLDKPIDVETLREIVDRFARSEVGSRSRALPSLRS